MSGGDGHSITKLPLRRCLNGASLRRGAPMASKTPCPACNGDMGVYTDMCDRCWQLRTHLDTLGMRTALAEHDLKSPDEILAYFGLRRIEKGDTDAIDQL